MPLVAYFSMEIALRPEIPTYSGGLGMLAGDTIRAAVDLQLPMVAVSLVHHKGYFRQRLDPSGWQTEEPARWKVEEHAEEMPARVSINLEGRPVWIRAWKYRATAQAGSEFYVPVYLLDVDLPENAESDRTLTDYLYGGDLTYRLCQEVILGIGGVRMLRALGYSEIGRFHMNEGHAAFLTVELLREEVGKSDRQTAVTADIEAVRAKCIFTTHTPVAAGQDQFPTELIHAKFGMPEMFLEMKDPISLKLAAELFQATGETSLPALLAGGHKLNMTYLALSLSHYVNGVAKRHGEISRLLFAGYRIDAITNGVHAATWAAPSFHELFDRYIPGWREDPFSLRYALGIPTYEIWDAHRQAKQALLDRIAIDTGTRLSPDVLTIGFARRAATYKRADLLFQNLDRLRAIASKIGKVQIVYAGKAHPQDYPGKELIKRVFAAKSALGDAVPVVYLPDYDWELGQRITSGVDLWLNTPQPPMEASGTSGMKAAVNGVPSLSILDGWWIEGCIEGRTGWSIGDGATAALGDQERSAADAESLYDRLEQLIVPQFYRERDRYIDVMRHAIALNGSFFNAQRMLQQYVVKAYFV
ncbi:MAG: alpha-glucan family phosphorylase [Candidatus Eisenbacteria bacterium]